MVKRYFKHVISSGFEPETDRLEICCSIQLSYETIANIFRGANMLKLNETGNSNILKDGKLRSYIS